jgi:hypothetical protein
MRVTATRKWPGHGKTYNGEGGEHGGDRVRNWPLDEVVHLLLLQLLGCFERVH